MEGKIIRAKINIFIIRETKDPCNTNCCFDAKYSVVFTYTLNQC